MSHFRNNLKNSVEYLTQTTALGDSLRIAVQVAVLIMAAVLFAYIVLLMSTVVVIPIPIFHIILLYFIVVLGKDENIILTPLTALWQITIIICWNFVLGSIYALCKDLVVACSQSTSMPDDNGCTSGFTASTLSSQLPEGIPYIAIATEQESEQAFGSCWIDTCTPVPHGAAPFSPGVQHN